MIRKYMGCDLFFVHLFAFHSGECDKLLPQLTRDGSRTVFS